MHLTDGLIRLLFLVESVRSVHRLYRRRYWYHGEHAATTTAAAAYHTGDHRS
jgi:hypothetical protein